MVAPPQHDLWSIERHWHEFAGSIGQDVTGFDPASPRVRQAVACGAAVTLAVLAAVVLELDYPMWSGMSAFTCLQGSAVATRLKGLLRILGTIAGAFVGAVVIGFVAQDHLALLLALFVGVTFALYRSYLSRWMYAWLLGGVTLGLVLMTTLADATAGLHAGAYRAAEIAVGVLAAWAAGVSLLPEATDAATDWKLMADPKQHSRQRAALTALEGGSGIVAVVILYDLFDLPGFASGTISITRIADPEPQVGRHRGFLRLIGCIIGGGAGLLTVGFSIDWFPVLLVWVFAWCTVFGYFGSGSAGSGYAGMQAAFAFCMAVLPANWPATTLDPALDRFAGIVLAMAVFWVIDLIVGTAEEDHGAPTPTARERAS
jgi:uncharacterized membrane protein YccC